MTARMSEAEGLMWTLEKDPFLRSDFLNVTILDQAPDPDRLAAKVELAVERLPRLRQRVAGAPLRLAPPEWVDDPRFDLDYHLRRATLPAPGGVRELLDLAAETVVAPFDRARPLWQFTLVEGLAGDRTALLQKLHHTITDGVGGLRLSLELLDFERHPEHTATPEGRAGTTGTPSPLALLSRAAQAAARQRVQMARSALSPGALARGLRPARLAGAARSVRRQVLVTGRALSPVMTERSLRRHLAVHSVELDDLKRAGKAVGGTVNDAFVAGVAGGLGRYHDRLGQPVGSLRMAMPVNLRQRGVDGAEAEAEGGNQFAPARVVVPTAVGDPAAHLAAVAECLRGLRAEPALGLAETLAGVVGLLPTAVVVPLARAQVRTIDFATSNLRGSPVDLFLAGARIEASHPMGPLTGAALNVTALSYGGSFDMGAALDPAAVTEPELFTACLRESFDAVASLA